ncbi:MAG TPA: TonB-dependent receptor plug domain-containing protein, partial [Rariglobus sp.]
MKQPHRTNRSHLRLTLPLTALLALPPPALLFAQTAADTEESVALPTVVVTGEKVATDSSFGTRINTALIETPQAISVVTRAEMDARGVQRLTDAVGYTAGVRPESGGIDSRTEFLTIRGYSVSGSGNSYIYLDGLRGLTGGGWTYSSFDTFGLERVEILKGPSAVLYGQVSPGGIVNAVSKRPDAAQPDSVGVQYGSFNTVQGTFDVGGGNQDGSLQFRLLGLGRDGESEIDHTDLRRTFVAPSLTWNISERTSLTFLVQHQKDEGGSTFQFLPRTGTLVSGTGGFRFDQSDFIGESDWNNYERTQYALGYQFEHAFNDT